MGTKLFLIGGVVDKGTQLNTIEAVDLVNSVDVQIPVTLPYPLAYPAAAVSNCLVRAAGFVVNLSVLCMLGAPFPSGCDRCTHSEYVLVLVLG